MIGAGSSRTSLGGRSLPGQAGPVHFCSYASFCYPGGEETL